MKNIESRKGISLVALVITIIVLVILTGAVVITGINVPQNAGNAIKEHNKLIIQEAVTQKMLNNSMLAIQKGYNESNYKWTGIVDGYVYSNATPSIGPAYIAKINGINATKLSEEIRKDVNIDEVEFSKFYVDTKGLVYYYDDIEDTLEVNPVSDYSWYIGQSGTEYTISNINELVAFSNIVNGTAEGIEQDSFLGKKVLLSGNINMAGIKWIPIGGYVGEFQFKGIFDGGNNTISNLKVSYTGSTEATVYIGLFSRIYNAEIKNIKMQNVNISATGTNVYAGILAGYASNATISDIIKFSNINIFGTNNMNIVSKASSSNVSVGGIVGYTHNSDIDNINVDGLVVNVESVKNTVGGIAGVINSLSYAETTLDNFDISDVIINVEKGSSYLGGAIGLINRGNLDVNEVQGSKGVISNLELNSLDTSASAVVGGFIGYSYKQGDNYYSQDGIYYCDDPMTVKNITITDLDINVEYAAQMGGLVGWSQSFAEYKDCFVSGSIVENTSNGNTASECGGFVGIAHDRTNVFTNCIADVDMNISYTSGGFIGNITANGGNMNVEFYECIAQGDVFGGNAGGFAGFVNQRNGGDVIINECTSLGSVYGTMSSGGLIGSTREDCYEIIIEDSNVSENVSGSEDAKIAAVIGYVDMLTGQSLTILNTTYNTELPITNFANTGSSL